MSASSNLRPDSPIDCLVIGAGLAGLSCAVRLHESGLRVLVLEGSEGAGGRVRTDVVDHFLLDRGFQVYLDAYPQAREFLNLPKLDLRPFAPGALVWKDGKLRPVMDPFRRPTAALTSALQPIGSLKDKMLVARLRLTIARKPIEAIWSAPEKSTEAYLRDFGFSPLMIDDFFRGFYGGIFLEDRLSTSSRIFEFTFKMFALGSATLPAKGMQAIPDQLVSRLSENSIRFNTSVEAIEGAQVMTHGETWEARHLVLAVDGGTAHRLVPDIPPPDWNSTVCLHFSANKPPITSPVIALKGDRNGLINNVCVPSQISPGYAPEGKSLVCVSVLGADEIDESFMESIKKELTDWFGENVSQWKLLRAECVRKALPIDPPGHLAPPGNTGPPLFCGDFTTSGSIEGAILSGLRAAEQILSANGHAKGST